MFLAHTNGQSRKEEVNQQHPLDGRCHVSPDPGPLIGRFVCIPLGARQAFGPDHMTGQHH